jgi:FKBP-type peptidyl-prolyl cis-trans isomerase
MRSFLFLATFAAGLATVGAASAQAPAAAPPAAPAAAAAPAPPPPVPAAEFLAKNATAPGVKVLPSGLQYKVVKSGDPKTGSPKEGDVIKVNYEGSLTNGVVFDSTFERGKPTLMQLYGLVQAWMEALPQMHTGDEWVLYVPPELGYGGRGAGPIPPDSALVFRLQLLGWLGAD